VPLAGLLSTSGREKGLCAGAGDGKMHRNDDDKTKIDFTDISLTTAATSTATIMHGRRGSGVACNGGVARIRSVLTAAVETVDLTWIDSNYLNNVHCSVVVNDRCTLKQ
jgi:hypothetical protein